MPSAKAPFSLRGMELKNRLLRSATMENMADVDGYVTEDLLEVYYHLTRGGVGLIISGAAAVSEAGRAWSRQMGIWDDKFIPGLSRLARVVHAFDPGCKCAVQLHHQGSVGFGYSYGAVDQGFSLADMSHDDIEQTIAGFADAAGRAQQAGFDAVAVHGAHGYLPSEFFSPVTNQRGDAWGGDIDGRMRFSLELCRAIRARVGHDMPILWKLNTADFAQGGAEIEAYALLASALVAQGVDLIEMSGGIKEQMKLRALLKKEAAQREAYFAPAVEAFRRAVGDGGLAITGGVRSLPVMEELLGSGLDLIGLSRPLIAEPDLPKRLLHGPDRRPAKCTSCNRCLARIARQPLKCVEFDNFNQVLRRLESTTGV